ncbi:MAG: hypothetical protein V1755_15755, partial [Chloroflexota bacterium]
LSGEPNWPEGSEPGATQVNLQVPPPYAVRKTEDPTECFSHKGTLALCKQAIANPAASDFILVWEWVSHIDFSGKTAWLNAIDGYRVYKIDPPTGIRQFMKTVDPAARKIALLPVPPGKACYGVEAYAKGFQYGGLIVSPMVTHCLGEGPPTKTILLKPINWLSTGRFWETGECFSKSFLHEIIWDRITPGEVMVGSTVSNSSKCLSGAHHSAAVKFILPTLPGGAVVQSARLRFAETFNIYAVSGLATNFKLACAGEWGIAKQDWTGLVNDPHYIDFFSQPKGLGTATDYKPLDSLSGWDHSPEVDVKWQVIDWFEHPANNHGFILAPRPVPGATEPDAGAECFSRFANFELEIKYFTP